MVKVARVPVGSFTPPTHGRPPWTSPGYPWVWRLLCEARLCRGQVRSRSFTNRPGYLLELLVGHIRRGSAPHFFAQRLHGGLDPIIDIGIADHTSEFVVPDREH